jgi:hypothetical protein
MSADPLFTRGKGGGVGVICTLASMGSNMIPWKILDSRLTLPR